MYQHIFVPQHHIGLLFHRGDMERVMRPGSHHIFGSNRTVTLCDQSADRLRHPKLETLLEHDELRQMLRVIDLNDDQRALVWRSGRLQEILAPGLYAWFKEPFPVDVEIYDTHEFQFNHPRGEVIMNHPEAKRHLSRVEVSVHQNVLLLRDGKLEARLEAGSHLFWKRGDLRHWVVDLREQCMDVSGQEIMTADKVTLRINLVLNYKVTDVEKATFTVADYAQALYREAQLVLRAAVGTRNLDKLLSEKDAVGREVAHELALRAGELGLKLASVGVRDIILPGDMKLLLNRVTEAQKEAEANLIRRREETAASRSQANTARLMVENPALLRMKELETLQEILKGAKTTFLLGSNDLAGQLRGLIAQENLTS